MECKDYRTAIAAEPGGGFDGAAHGSDCSSCAAFRDDMLRLDVKISAALQIPLPPLRLPQLPALTAGDNVVELPPRQNGPVRIPAWLGVAAGIALAAVVGFQLVLHKTAYPGLGAEIMAHLDHEPAALNMTVEVSERRLSRALNARVDKLDTGSSLVTYARTCVINGHEVPHLVLQGRNGPITVLLLPDEKIDHAEQIEGKGTQGVILPVGNGSIAIVGNNGESLEDLQQQLTDSVKWKI